MTDTPPDDLIMDILTLAHDLRPRLDKCLTSDGPTQSVERLTQGIMAVAVALESSGSDLMVACDAAIDVFRHIEITRRQSGLPPPAPGLH